MTAADIDSMSSQEVLSYFDLYVDYINTQADALMDILGMDLHKLTTVSAVDRMNDYLWIEFVRSFLTPESYEELEELISRCELLEQRYINANDTDFLSFYL